MLSVLETSKQKKHLEIGQIRGKTRILKIDTYRNNVGKIEKIFSNYPPLLEWWDKIIIDPSK